MRANRRFVGVFSTSSPCQTGTGVSDGLVPSLASSASAIGSSSPTQTYGIRLRAANSLRRVASPEWREPMILKPRPTFIMYERLARKALRKMSEMFGSSVTTS